MAIGRPIDLSANVTRKLVSETASGVTTTFTITGGYRINELGVYRNGVRLVQNKDFTANDGSANNGGSGGGGKGVTGNDGTKD